MIPEWLPDGWTLTPDGWATTDLALLERLRRGPFSFSDAVGFWFFRDLRAPKIWALWVLALASSAYGIVCSNHPAVSLGLMALGFWVFTFSSMVKSWMFAKVKEALVIRLIPHPFPGYAGGHLSDGRKVGLDAATAKALASRGDGTFECLYVLDTDPMAFQMVLAVRVRDQLSPGALVSQSLAPGPLPSAADQSD